MNPLGELFIKIGADVKGMVQGLDKAETRMGKFSSAIKKHHKAIGMAMMAVGAAVIAAGLKSIKTWAAMGDEIGKMAKRTGFTTVALSELRHAAELSGTALASIEKASRTLSGAILDAGYGLETYVRAFAQLGLTYEELAKLSPEQQFLIVLEALAALDDEFKRAGLASDIFGRAGTQLLPMLEQGAEGLKEMRLEAHELGVVFEDTKPAEDFTDTITNLNTAVDGLQLTLAKILAPALEDIIEDITEALIGVMDWAKENPKLTDTIVKAFIALTALVGIMGGLLLGGKVLLPLLHFLKAAFVKIAGTTIALKIALFFLSAGIATLVGVVAGLIWGIGMLAFGISELMKQSKERKRQLIEEAKLEELNTKLKEEHAKAIKGLENNYVDLLEEAKEAGYALGIEGELYITAIRSAEIMKERQEALQAEHKKLTDAIKTQNDALKEQLRIERELAAFSEAMGVLRMKFGARGMTEAEFAKWRPFMTEAGILQPIAQGAEQPIQINLVVDEEVLGRADAMYLGRRTLSRSRMR